jgi:hypothetical protein
MLSIAYRYLKNQAGVEITKNLLSSMSLNEVKDTVDWICVTDTIDQSKSIKPSIFPGHRVRIVTLNL